MEGETRPNQTLSRKCSRGRLQTDGHARCSRTRGPVDPFASRQDGQRMRYRRQARHGISPHPMSSIDRATGGSGCVLGESRCESLRAAVSLSHEDLRKGSSSSSWCLALPKNLFVTSGATADSIRPRAQSPERRALLAAVRIVASFPRAHRVPEVRIRGGRGAALALHLFVLAGQQLRHYAAAPRQTDPRPAANSKGPRDNLSSAY